MHQLTMSSIQIDTELSPAAAFRNNYYLSQQQEEDDIEKKVNSSRLLSKLAPMRAKLSKKTNLDLLWHNSTLTLRKSAENNSIRKKKDFECTDFIMYPALLSKVAYAFKENMVVSTKSKDSITYHEVFDGRDAVNKLASIIKTTDRNLAILIGRALDHQKFFHDVNYEHRLRDSLNELYQFTDNTKKLSSDSALTLHSNTNDLPNGVFTLLTDCYSATCTRDNSCYSVLCPRRLNQKTQNFLSEENEQRLWINTVSKTILNNLSSNEIRRQENIFELIYTEKDFVDDLIYVEQNWILPLLSHESIQTDRAEDFVKELFWNLPQIRQSNALLLGDLLQRQQLDKVVDQIGDVFLNHVSTVFEPFVKYGAHQVISKYIFETEKSNNLAFTKLVETIERSPKSRKLELNGYLTKPTTRLGRYNLLLREILKHTPKNHPDHTSIPKVMKLINTFLERVNEESGKSENKLSLQILEKKLSFKKLHNQEIEALDLLSDERKIIIKGSLKRKTGNAEASDLQIYVLDHCLLVMKSKFFDNFENYKLYRKPIPLALLAISLPDQAKRSSSILPYNRSSTGSFYSSGNTTTDTLTPSTSTIMNNTNNKNGYPISFVHLGRQGSGTLTLYTSTLASRRKWVDTIEKYRHSIMEKEKVFQMIDISDQYFNSFNKVNCVATYGNSIMIGCDHGVYLKKSIYNNKDMDEEESMTRILSIDKVSQIDILEGPKLMLILADKILYTYSIDSLFDQDHNYILTNFVSASLSSPSSTSKMKTMGESSIKSSTSSSAESHDSKNRFIKTCSKKIPIRKISSNVSFFKVGKVFDKTYPQDPIERTLVCFVKYNAMTSTIRALEPYDESQDAKKKKRKSNHLGLFMRNSTDVLRGFKDLYIPGEATSIQYFKNVICVGSAKGFQMVDIGSAGVQSVLDPNDGNHDFISQRETLKPISMFRHPDNLILLCYNEIAFYIDKKGRRVRSDWIIHWEGYPTSFAFHYPYVLAFDSSFIEIRHINTGDLTQVIPGNNIRCLRPDPSDTIYCVMEDRRLGNELVFSLKYVF